MIIGHGRHGKDTFCDLLATRGYTFESSSYLAYQIFIYDLFKDRYGYTSLQEAYEDRFRHRAELFTLISNYNSPDKGRLAKEIYKEYDIYCGIRSKEEFYSLRKDNAFDYAIWIDASDRMPPEGSDSMNIEIADADFVINNNGPQEALNGEVNKWMSYIDPSWKNV